VTLYMLGGVHAGEGVLRGGFMFNGTLPITHTTVTLAKRKKKGKGKKAAKAK
jgi:hypothetical protein